MQNRIEAIMFNYYTCHIRPTCGRPRDCFGFHVDKCGTLGRTRLAVANLLWRRAWQAQTKLNLSSVDPSLSQNCKKMQEIYLV